jgi:HAE1 family hydrophobic/amphiphilic exporter-1
MLSDFFIKRPVFAGVTGLVILLLGLIVLPFLPVNQYPDIAPPQVQVTAAYAGANAETVEAAVTTPLEQAINGVEGLRYLQSISSSDGFSSVIATMEPWRNEDLAVADVKNRVDQATGRLPAEVNATGVNVQKSSNSIVLGVAFFSPDGSVDQQTISNYIERNVVDKLKRLEGVGAVNMFGERRYAMRLWLDPMKLAAQSLTVADVVTAVRQQNIAVPAGQIGAKPLHKTSMVQLPILVEGRLPDADAFNKLALRQTPNGGVIRLADVGYAELGSENYATSIRWRGMESVGFRVDQLPQANALKVSQSVRQALVEMAKELPKGVSYAIGFDPTGFISDSIDAVSHTLIEAIFFVVLVIFLFLQAWRTTLIPAIIIPISLVGTFLFMKLFGFSINMLTLFGLILATGIVVDDAIVVVENIARKLEDNPELSTEEAASQGMAEVFGAVIATSLVLIAVFVPVAFFPGTTGKLYQQFALTIAFSVAISTFNAVTLTPALCALLLGRKAEKSNRVFDTVNRAINATIRGYQLTLQQVMRLRYAALGVFLALILATGYLFTAIPKGFVPSEDQGYFIIVAQGPEGVSADYMTGVIKKIEAIMLPNEEVNGVFAVNGFGFNGNAPNKMLAFVPLKPIGERMEEGSGHTMFDVINRVRGPLSAIPDAFVVPFEPPAVRGLGSTGGFSYHLQDKRGQSNLAELASTQFALMGASQQRPELTGVFATFTADSPLLRVTLDREKAVSLGLAPAEVLQVLQVLMGSLYINDFTYQDRSHRVIVQADSHFRDSPDVLQQLYVRNNQGRMLPASTVLSVAEDSGAQVISHFNLFRSTEISGSAAPGFSSGQALNAMQAMSKDILPEGMGFEWSGIAFEQLRSGGETLLFMGLGLIFVYLVLAAQYESLLDPLIILLSVPTAMLGALALIQFRGMDNNVFTQVGLVLLVGLASKNAILIVEFANQLREQGRGIIRAAFEASALRFRPIVMTSLAFIIGVLPLVTATGAGAMARQAMGTAVFGGMVASTVLSLYLVPVIYITLKQLQVWVMAKVKRSEVA